jgi:hypothetical protein
MEFENPDQEENLEKLMTWLTPRSVKDELRRRDAGSRLS